MAAFVENAATHRLKCTHLLPAQKRFYLFGGRDAGTLYALESIMMRVLRLPLGISVAALVVAAGLRYGLPRSVDEGKQQLADVFDELAEVSESVTKLVTGVPGNAAAPATVAAAKEIFPPGTKTILLSEPVIILGSSAQPREALPKGSQVALIGTYGEYSRVRYQNRVITVPTKSVVAGAYVSN